MAWIRDQLSWWSPWPYLVFGLVCLFTFARIGEMCAGSTAEVVVNVGWALMAVAFVVAFAMWLRAIYLSTTWSRRLVVLAGGLLCVPILGYALLLAVFIGIRNCPGT